MGKKDKDSNEDIAKMFAMAALIGGGKSGLLGGLFSSETSRDKRNDDVYHLGHGLSLVLDETIENNRERYCRLYKGLECISDDWFRLGGLSSGFNDKPYTSIIHYIKNDKGEFNWGKHAIIDSEGKIVLEQNESMMDYPYYSDGVIATYKNEYINLLTGETIVRASGSSHTLKSKKYLFVEHKYNYSSKNEKQYKLGVYKIELETGAYEIFE